MVFQATNGILYISFSSARSILLTDSWTQTSFDISHMQGQELTSKQWNHLHLHLIKRLQDIITALVGEMLTYYSKNQDDILDYECVHCNQRMRATQRHCKCCYPKILCIGLCRNRYDRNTRTLSRIQSSFGYPVENFKPNESFGSHAGTDDVIYDLVATINHQPTFKNQGHFTTIS